MDKKEERLRARALELYKEHNSSDKAALSLSLELGLPIEKVSTLSRNIRLWANGRNKGKAQATEYEVAKEKAINESKYYIISSAQNGTPVHNGLFENIKAYSKEIGAEILIIPIRYKNPTSVFQDQQREWWDKYTHEYLLARRVDLPHVTIVGDIKMQPTAKDPLSGLESLTNDNTSIFAHPKQHMKTLPTLGANKFIYTTGSVTVENYTDSKAGKVAEFHHVLGFVILEVSENEYHIRHVSAEPDGSFYDLDYSVENGIATKSESAIECIVLGDIHSGSTNKEAYDTTKEMLQRFNPKNIVLHDLFDGSSINHHEKNNPFLLIEKEQEGKLDLYKEIENALNLLAEFIEYNPIVVRSNHDEFIEKWICDTDWRKAQNKEAYLRLANLRLTDLNKSVLKLLIELRFGDKIIVLAENDSYLVNGIEVGQHGHIGANGSRGGALQFFRINKKMICGHSHSPVLKDGFMSVGTLTDLRLGYNKGLSAWAHSNAIIHKNGKRQNLIITNGKYTTL